MKKKGNDSKDDFGKFKCNRVSRRDFIKTSAAFIAGASLSSYISCGGSGKKADPLPEYQTYYESNSTVAIVGGPDSIYNKVLDAVNIAGGLDYISSGTVFIKVNVISPDVRCCTNPDVLRSVIQLVKERTLAENITVGDFFTRNNQSPYKITGLIDAVCSDEGVNFIDLTEDTQMEINPAQPLYYLPEGFRVSQEIVTSDHLIHVPVLKNHSWHENTDNSNLFTLCQKSYVGCMYWKDRQELFYTANPFYDLHGSNFPEKTVELGLMRDGNSPEKRILNICDATNITLDGGPAYFISGIEDAGLILASTDRVACDSLGLAVIRYYADQAGVSGKRYQEMTVWDNRAVIHGGVTGQGNNDPEKISIVHSSTSDIDGIMDKWSET